MTQHLDILSFVNGLNHHHLILDVRSPSEFLNAHIPNAINIPLFTDEERKVVGTTYKQVSREAAIKIGLDYFGPKMRSMVETVEKHLLEKGNDLPIIVHCWRGGMRSTAVAWLLDLYGFKILKLEGGYKAYRNWVLDLFRHPYDLRILGGYTGSGKTIMLHELKSKGHAVLDLEHLANHKGSSFGHIDMPPQPSQEMFENLIAQELFPIKDQTIWVEDESARIGHVNVPFSLYATMSNSACVFINVPFKERLKYTIAEYGSLPKEDMIAAINRIHKRLGGLDTKNAIEYLQNSNVVDSFHILLKYYDRHYEKAQTKKQDRIDKTKTIYIPDLNHKINVKELLPFA